MPSFSDRFPVRPQPPDQLVHDKAPSELRAMLLHSALDFSADAARSLLTEATGVLPDLSNWSASNVERECVALIERAEWWQVFDLSELIYAHLNRRGDERASEFEEKLNRRLVHLGLGWKMQAGKLLAVSSSALDVDLEKAAAALKDAKLVTAGSELSLARRCLSTRPTPDVTGAVQHSVAALECVARKVMNAPSATLGELNKRMSLPHPLPKLVDGIWGFSSQQGRHLNEDRGPPSFHEAELIVSLSASLALYLLTEKA